MKKLKFGDKTGLVLSIISSVVGVATFIHNAKKGESDLETTKKKVEELEKAVFKNP